MAGLLGVAGPRPGRGRGSLAGSQWPTTAPGEWLPAAARVAASALARAGPRGCGPGCAPAAQSATPCAQRVHLQPGPGGKHSNVLCIVWRLRQLRDRPQASNLGRLDRAVASSAVPRKTVSYPILPVMQCGKKRACATAMRARLAGSMWQRWLDQRAPGWRSSCDPTCNAVRQETSVCNSDACTPGREYVAEVAGPARTRLAQQLHAACDECEADAEYPADRALRRRVSAFQATSRPLSAYCSAF